MMTKLHKDIAMHMIECVQSEDYTDSATIKVTREGYIEREREREREREEGHASYYSHSCGVHTVHFALSLFPTNHRKCPRRPRN